MRITDFAIALMIILIPFFVKLQLDQNAAGAAQHATVHYNNALAVAAQDATFNMRLNSMQNAENTYESLKYNRVDKEMALDTFWRTLYVNFGANGQTAKRTLQSYVPVVGIIDYDGVQLNVYRNWRNSKNEVITDRVWLPKYPYTYRDEFGNTISFTLDEYVRVFEVQKNTWTEGQREEIKQQVNIPLLTDAKRFDTIRRTTIVQTLQERLGYHINQHNAYKLRLGITYDFSLPLISKDTWYNSIDDIGVLAFIQGYPIAATEQTFNNYALGGARLTKSKNYYGVLESGRRVAYREDCYNSAPVGSEVLFSARQAASQGYWVSRECKR